MNTGKEVSAVVLAGGRGARMGEATNQMQKCMLPVEGQPVLQHILDNVQQAFGSANIVIATGHQGASVREYFGSQYGNINIEYVHSEELLETRRRLLLARGLIKGPFLYMAGDVISNPNQLVKVAEGFEGEKGTGIMGVISGAIDHSPASTHAIITARGKRAVEFVYPATSTWNPDQLREMNIAYYDQRFFHMLRNSPKTQGFIIPVIIDALRHGVEFVVERYFDRWYHFAEPKDYEAKIIFNGGENKD